MEYYFDIETTGTDPEKHKIITIQWQELDRSTGKPISELHILKEWESSEKEILENFLPHIQAEYKFSFIPIGMNLLFDFDFIDKKAKKNGLKSFELSDCKELPFLDLKHVLVLINRSQFMAYDELLEKGEKTNDMIGPLYNDEDYDKILEYINKETEIFLKAFQLLKNEMPKLKEYLKKKN